MIRGSVAHIAVGREGDRLVLEGRKAAHVMDLALFVEGCNWLGANHLATTSGHLLEADPELGVSGSRLHQHFDHGAAEIGLGNDAVGTMPVGTVHRYLAPYGRRILYGLIF